MSAASPGITAIINTIEQLIAELKSTHPFTAYLLTVVKLSREQGADMAFIANSIGLHTETDVEFSKTDKTMGRQER